MTRPPLDIPYHILSLDVETSGLDPQRHSILSAALVDPKTRDSVYVEFHHHEILTTVEALRINRLDLRRVPQEKGADRLFAKGDAMGILFRWIEKHVPMDPDMPNCFIPIRTLGKQPWFDRAFLQVIWNEGIDGPFDVPPFPFTHRCVDLNTMYAAIAALTDRWAEDVRKEIVHEASLLIPPSVKSLGEHHALYDAQENVGAWERCLSRLHAAKP